MNGDLEDYFQEPKLFIFKSGVGHIVFDLTNSLNTYKFNENYKLIPMKKSMAEIFQNGINNFNPYTILNGVDQFTSLNETTKNNWFFNKYGYN